MWWRAHLKQFDVQPFLPGTTFTLFSFLHDCWGPEVWELWKIELIKKVSKVSSGLSYRSMKEQGSAKRNEKFLNRKLDNQSSKISWDTTCCQDTNPHNKLTWILKGEENLETNQPVLASVTIVAYISCFSFGGLSTHTFTITWTKNINHTLQIIHTFAIFHSKSQPLQVYTLKFSNIQTLSFDTFTWMSHSR